MLQTDIELGQIVEDNISGFTGVVVTVGDHISGCDRIGVRAIGEEKTDTRSGREWFYPDQLSIVEEENEYTEEINARTDTGFELGNLVTDNVTGFSGFVTVINYHLFNCPCLCVQPESDEDGLDDGQWFDDVRLEKKSSTTFDFYEEIDKENTQSTGSGELQRTRNDSR
jgi:heat shock protein HspQ